MKERPILFSTPMVRAILDDSKSQTRRVAKLTDAGHVKEPGGHRRWHTADPNAGLACPYGQPGDQLWVRETWVDLQGTGIEHRPTFRSAPQRYAYGADTLPGSYGDDMRKAYGVKWKPSIHMPRAASRITLEVTGVRVERLQDISRGDAMSEGCPFPNMAQGDDPRNWYADLWDSINGPGAWDLNPMVWVVEFKRVTPCP